MQLDAEEDETLFYKPPVEPTARESRESEDSQTLAESSVAEEDDE